jgi:uncharacterized protein (DUF58 family)
MPPAQQRLQPVLLEDCRIRFRNFSGLEGKFNAAGQRNFNVLLEDDVAQAMLADGWNVKWLQPKEEDDQPQAILKVKVKYPGAGSKGRPPNIVLITQRGKTPLDEGMVNILDWADIIHVDLIVRPSEYDVGGRQGISAYVKSLYVTIQEDALEQKYADVPDSAQNSITVHEGEEKPPWEE